LRVGQPQDKGARVPPRGIVLISDGAQDGGRIKPTDAAQQAKRRGVPVYTVLVGTPDGVVQESLPGGLRRIIHVPPSPETLQQVASDSGGQFFRALDTTQLSKVYEDLGSRLGKRSEDREITDVFAAFAAGLLLVSGLTSAFLLRGVT
jgi:Ca-activated chloride channel homolog